MAEEERKAVPSEPVEEEKNPYVPATKKQRVAAWIGVIFMVFLVLGFTYSLATGGIFWW